MRTFHIILYTLSFLALTHFDLIGQSSEVFDDLSLNSEILNKQKKFSIYLPPGYADSNQNYPVVYLLHGAGSGDSKHQDWIKAGNMKSITDQAISSGTIKPMVIVMPDAGMTYYMNNAEGKYQFEDYFFKELIPYIEGKYRVKKDKKNRAIAGLSMGGFGALIYGLHHPNVFSSVVGMSAAIRTNDQINALSLSGYLQRYRIPMGELKQDDERITDFWYANSPIYLANANQIENIKSVRYFLDIGDEDQFVTGNNVFQESFKNRKIPIEYRIRKGKHNWEFWKSGLPTALKFIDKGFEH